MLGRDYSIRGTDWAPAFKINRGGATKQSKNTRYGTGGRGGPHSDLNITNPYVANNAVSERDARQQQMVNELGGADKSISVRAGTQELESLVNLRQQKGYPTIIRQIIVRNAIGGDDPHFSLLPPKQISEAELSGFEIQTFEMDEHLPRPLSEFVPAPYLSWQTRSHMQGVERIGYAYRISGDIAFTPHGNELEMLQKQSAADQMYKYAACKVTQSIISVPDRYRTKRSQTLGAQFSRRELEERRNTYRGPMNHGELLADPGMFGVLNRPQGFEFMMAWVQRMFSEHGFQLTHMVKNRGILENLAFTPSRTQYANRGEESTRILKGGETAMNNLITEQFPGLTIVDEHTYTTANMPNETLSLLNPTAQIGRYMLLDNEPYEQLISTISPNDYGDRCESGSMRVNDLYYLDLSGRGTIACKKYEELIRACACFDDYGRLDRELYDDITGSSNWEQFAKKKLHMNVTDASRFKIDPWVVHNGERTHLVRIVGNQDTHYTNAETLNVIKNAACRSMQKKIGKSDYEAIEFTIKFLHGNYKATCDREGNVEAYYAATAWENVSITDLDPNDMTKTSELQNTLGGVRPPCLSPIRIYGGSGEVSATYSAFTSMNTTNQRCVLAKIPLISHGQTERFSVTQFIAHATTANMSTTKMNKIIALARAFPHYVWIPDEARTGAFFDDTTGLFNNDIFRNHPVRDSSGTIRQNASGQNIEVPNYSFGDMPVRLQNNADVQLAVWPNDRRGNGVMPSFYTIGCLRALIDVYESDSTANGWINVIGLENMMTLQRGLEALDRYAMNIQTVFSPNGHSHANLDRNFFFRESLLPVFQRIAHQESTNELTAFLQNAVLGVAGETAIISPFFLIHDRGGRRVRDSRGVGSITTRPDPNIIRFMYTPRYAAPLGNNALSSYSVGVYRQDFSGNASGRSVMIPNAGERVLPGVFEGTLGSFDGQLQPPSTTRRPTPGKLSEYLAYPNEEGNFEKRKLRHSVATKILGANNNYTNDSMNIIDTTLREWLNENDNTFNVTNIPAYNNTSSLFKRYVAVGFMLNSLQTGEFKELNKYFRNVQTMDENMSSTSSRQYQSGTLPNLPQWRDFNQKWNDIYENNSLMPTLKRVTDMIVNKITDKQINDLVSMNNSDDYRELMINLNVFPWLLNTVFLHIENQDIEDDDDEVSSESRYVFAPLKHPSAGSASTSSATATADSEEAIATLYTVFRESVAKTLAQSAQVDRDTAAPSGGTAPSQANTDNMQVLYSFLQANDRITHMVGMRLCTHEGYWRSVEKIAVEIYGHEIPKGYGASLSIIRPASATEPGVFAGAPPMSTNVRGSTANMQDWQNTYSNLYTDIMTHGAACRRHGGVRRDHADADHQLQRRDGRSYLGITMDVAPAYMNHRAHGAAPRRNNASDFVDSGHGVLAALDTFSTVAHGRKRAVDQSVYNVALSGLVPGVSADEIPNRFFHERLNELGIDVEQRWDMRSVMYAYLGASVSAQLMINLHQCGIPCPMTLIVLEPFINISMRSIIFAQGGESLGFLAHCMNIEREGWDTISTEYHVQITTYIGGIITNGEQVLQLPYVIFNRLERGGTLNLIKSYANMSRRGEDEHVDWDVNDPMNRNDGFVTHGGGSLTRQDLPEHIPLTGQVYGTQYSMFADRIIPLDSMPKIRDNMQAYPSAILLMLISRVYELNESTAIPERAHAPECIADLLEYPPGTTGSSWNMYCSIANQWMKDPSRIGHLILRNQGVAPGGHFEEGDGNIINGVPAALRGPLRDQGLIVGTV